MKYLYLHRPGVWVKNKPTAFWWKGPDGSSVLVKNDMDLGYNGVITPAIAKHLAAFSAETGLWFSVFVFGVGDHGGGPTRRDIVCALDMNTWPIFPNVRMSTAKAFFERLGKEGKKLPVLDCELNTEFTGCYTSQSLIKKANRYNEKNLVNTETASTMAWASLGRAYPADGFVTGWRDTLFSHFHDILPGSGVHDTRTYTHGLYQKTAAFTGAEETNALRFIASKIDTSSAGVGKRKAGCLLLNDSKHGYSLDGRTLRLTLIRSSYDPDPLPEIGRHEIHLALTPFAGDMPIADAVKKGLEFTNALRVVSTDAHGGPMPASAGLIDVATESVVVSAVKKGEEEDALILRFFDPTGKKAVAKAKLNPDFFGRITDVSEVDLLERPVARSTAAVQGNTVSVTVPSRGIATVKVKLKRK